MDHAIAYWMRDGGLKQGKPEAYFAFLKEKGHVVSLVGGGGKSSLQRYLARRFQENGMKTAAMTTTKIWRPAQFCTSIEDCRARWDAGEYAVCGEPFGEAKLSAPKEAFLAALLGEADAVVVEADGSRCLPCKAPAEHEPVILPKTDIVIAVMGLDALGKPVGEVCHRPERVCALLRCGEQHLITCEDAAKLLLSERGLRKGVGDRAYDVVLNKCDDALRLEQGKAILDILHAHGQTRAALTAGMHTDAGTHG